MPGGFSIRNANARFPLLAALCIAAHLACGNNPYGSFPENKVIFSAMSDDPRTLDPTRVGDTASNAIASNIHDTAYEFHYLKRPLTIIPSMATSLPIQGTTTFQGRQVHTFRFSIKKGLRFADDACFADGRGREITIDDFIYAIKRTADNALDPFGMPLLAGKVIGFDEFSAALDKAHEADAKVKRSGGEGSGEELDKAMAKEIPGVRRIDDRTIELLLSEEYPQVIYYFALVGGSPIPKECTAYYNGQNGRPAYDRHPAASGPFYVKEWHANYRMILARNPNYRKDDVYPSEGMPGDKEAGLLDRAGRSIPMVDEVRFQMIHAGPPIWTLFEQGYLDRAGIPREVYNQVIQDQRLSDQYKAQGIRLDREVDLATYWLNFNMDDPLFKGNVKLRRALSVVIDRKEMLDRFNNNRGIVAHSIIPPGIEGYFEDYQNPYADANLDLAKKLLAEAGYPGGIDPKTGRALRVNLTMVASAGATSMYRFYSDEYAKVNVELKIEQYDWPTVIEKKNKKTFQMIHGSWHADYPDPQNFLQLLYGPNAKSTYNENNYQNPEFDALYDQMKNMTPGPRRQEIIRRMLKIMADDAPVVLLFQPITFSLSHSWVAPIKQHPLDYNQLKYRDIDQARRTELAKEWNRTPWTAYALFIGVIGAVTLLVVSAIRQRRRA